MLNIENAEQRSLLNNRWGRKVLEWRPQIGRRSVSRLYQVGNECRWQVVVYRGILNGKHLFNSQRLPADNDALRLRSNATQRLLQHAHCAPPLCSRDYPTKLTPKLTLTISTYTVDNSGRRDLKFQAQKLTCRHLVGRLFLEYGNFRYAKNNCRVFTLIPSILRQHHISKELNLSRSRSVNVQVSLPYNAILQISIITEDKISQGSFAYKDFDMDKVLHRIPNWHATGRLLHRVALTLKENTIFCIEFLVLIKNRQ
ncbi:hypothetical protein MSG28_009883 [Choristoneura fumiferana]|uniref:Uncharacterized protein n=1 Tax=Choristoneura fumiferana TaxID=7141 RepID=A0ACC0JD07_CHOFU|nr:hypothetical protein MSG28_009883 [Choristoneura fumiferana]